MSRDTALNIKVNPKVGMGITSVAGFFLAFAQYLGAIAALLAGDLTEESIGLFATATATFVTVAWGRYQQARDIIQSNQTPSSESVAVVSSGPEPNVLYLDGDAIATALVKSLNTNALLASVREQKAEPATTGAGE